MRVALILLPLIGMCNGLWMGLEYLYKYNGRVQADIQDIRPFVAAASVKADILVQVVDRDNLVFKISDVQVADMNEDRDCDEWSHLPPLAQLKHRPMQDQAFLLEKPFKINVMDGKMDDLEVPQEPSWVTNMRKAMVEMFNNKILKVNYGVKENLFDLGRFVEDEETIFGQCKTSYTLNILTDGMAVVYGKVMQNLIDEDAQAPEVNDGSNFPVLEDKFWRARKKVEMTQCTSFVNVRNMGHQNDCVDNKARCSKNLNGRSSTSLFFLRGGPSGLRMEFAETTDFALVEPYQAHTEQVKIVTNRTLELFAVRPITNALRPEAGKTVTWRFDVVPNAAYQSGPFRQPTYEEIFTQMALEPDMVASLKESTIQGVADVAQQLASADRADILGEVDTISQNINYLSLNDIRDVYAKLQYDTSKNGIINAEIFLKILATSGSEQGNTFLLRMLADGQLNQELKTAFYMNMASCLQSANFILDFLDYVINLPITGDLDTLAILSMSVLANNCLMPDKRTIYQDVSCGGQGCDPVAVIQKFLPYLESGLNNNALETWQRLVFMQAIVNLKSPFIIDILRPYILGSASTDLTLRVNAIEALNVNKMPTEARTECLHLLMTVFDDLHEHHEVRQTAFLTMSAWNPSPSWWHSLALASWREPSKQMSSLIARVIKMTALTDMRQVDVATLVHPLAKPAPPASLSYPFYINIGYGTSSVLGLSWMNILLSSRNDNIFPRRIGFIFQAFRASTYFPATTLLKNAMFDVYGIDELWRALTGHFSKTDPDSEPDPAIKIVQGMYNQIMIKLDGEGKKRPEKASILLYAKLLHYFQFLVPAEFSAEDIINAPEKIKTLPAQINLNLQLFSNYGRIKWIFPTTLGFPAMVESSSPTMASMVGTFGVKPSGGSKEKFATYLDAVTKLSYKTIITCKAMIPWARKSIYAGIENTILINLPFNWQLAVDSKTMDLSLTVTPKIGNEQDIELVSAINMPFTVRVPIMPYTQLNTHNDWVLMFDLGVPDRRIEESWLPERTGMALVSRRKDFPTPLVNILPMPAPTLTLRYWAWELVWDLSKSDTKSVGFLLNYAFMDKGKGDARRAPPLPEDIDMMDLRDARTLSEEYQPRRRPEPYRAAPYGVPGVKWRRDRMLTDPQGPEEAEGQGGRVRRQSRYGRRRGYARRPEPTPPPAEEMSSGYRSPGYRPAGRPSAYSRPSYYERPSYGRPAFAEPTVPPTSAPDYEMYSPPAGPPAPLPPAPPVASQPSSPDYYDEFAETTDPMYMRQISGENVEVIQNLFNFEFSNVVRSLSAKLEFYGSVTRSFEGIFTWAGDGEGDLYYSKFQLAVFQSAIKGDPPYTTCLNVNAQWPWVLPLTTVKEYLEVASSGGSLVFDAALVTDDCFNGKPAMTMEGEFYLSDDGIAYIADSLASEEQCDFVEDDSAVVLRHRFFDNFRWDATVEDTIPIGLLNATYNVGDFFTYFLWPSIYFDHMKKNDPNAVTVTGTRSYYDSLWNVYVTAPSDTVLAERVPVPTPFEDLFGPLPFWDIITEEILVGAVPRVCKISETRMITFDGEFVGAGPDVCWVVAARDCTNNGDWQVQVRNTGVEISAKIIWPLGGIVVDLTRNVVKINSQVMKEKDLPEDSLYRFFKKGDTLYFMFGNGHYLRINDEIQFGASKWYRGKVCGSCGDMNGEMVSDLQGPRGCVFTDPKLFVLSWTISGDGCAGCNPFELSFRKLDVTNYQKVCPKKTVRPTAEIYPSPDAPAVRSCTSWVYQEKTVGQYSCVATQPTPNCRPGCKDVTPVSKPIEYECQLAQSPRGRYRRDAWMDICPTAIHYRALLTEFSGPCLTPLEN